MIPILYRETDRKGNILCFVQLFLAAPMLGLSFLSLYSSEWFLNGAHSALDILSGYLMWYRVLLWGGILVTAAALFLNTLIFRSLVKTKSFAPQHIYSAVIGFFLICIFSVLMIVSEGVPSLIRDARTDIAAIENHQLVSVTGQLTAESSSRSLSGPHRDDEPAPVAKTTLKPVDEDRYYVYLPVDKKAILTEGSIFFEVTHTPKFGVVVDVIPTETQ